MHRQIVIVRGERERAWLLAFLRAVSLAKPLRVTVEVERRKRSLSQNALYWEWMQTAAEHTGYSAEEVHEHMKERFCPPREVALAGEIRWVRSTTRLSTAEMAEYMDRVYALLVGEMAIYLPTPEARKE